MSNSLRDALLQSGLAISRQPRGKNVGKSAGKRKPRSQAGGSEDLDLAKAYAMRARADAREREAARREAEQRKREKLERRQRLQKLLEGKGLDDAAADCVRHYEFHGKIRRVHVTAAQLEALNAGALGVVQLRGRFLLVAADVAREAAAIEPDCVALLVDASAAATASDDVPDDLRW